MTVAAPAPAVRVLVAVLAQHLGPSINSPFAARHSVLQPLLLLFYLSSSCLFGNTGR